MKVADLTIEEFVLEPNRHSQALLKRIGIEPFEFQNEVQPNINDKYFALWNSDVRSLSKKLFDGFTVLFRRFKEFEKRANAFGYNVDTPKICCQSVGLGRMTIRYIGYHKRYHGVGYGVVQKV